MAKAPDAFRTISEVADWLDTPAHVLRFWESKFTQIKPVKRAGGRRYYRPEDMELLGGIKALLHDQGMTIKGVQKLLREQGVRHVGGFGPAIDGDSLTGVDTVPAQISVEAVVALASHPGPDFTALLAAIPAMPAMRATPPQPRLLAALHRAAPRALPPTAPRIRPLLRQLQDLRARMGHD